MKVYLSGKFSKILPLLSVLSGLILNKFVLERVLSSDGHIGSVITNILIVLCQFLLIGFGLLTYAKPLVIEVSARSIGSMLFLLFAIQSSFRHFLPEVGYLDSVLKLGYTRNDEAAAYENRFNCIRDALPQNQALGYMTSSEIRMNWAEFYHHYYLAQYTLTPHVLKDTVKIPLVINDFPAGFVNATNHKNVNPVIKDCQNGVALSVGNPE